jgi:hypothetical protein
MEIKRVTALGKGPADRFTGTVRIDPLFQPNEPAMTHIAIQEQLDGKRWTGWRRSAMHSTRKSQPPVTVS